MKTMRLGFTVVAFTCLLGSGFQAIAQTGANDKAAPPPTAEASTESSDINSLRAQRIEKAAMELTKHPTVLEAKAQGLKSYREGRTRQQARWNPLCTSGN